MTTVHVMTPSAPQLYTYLGIHIIKSGTCATHESYETSVTVILEKEN